MGIALSRPFARAVEDLDVDFTRADRPALVTELLTACAVPADPEYWWQSLLRDRIATLLALLRASEAGESIRITQRCDACGVPFEAELAFAELLQLRGAASVAEVTRADGTVLTVRLPRGDDLRRWSQSLAAHGADPREAMLSELRVAGELQPGSLLPDELDRAADALGEADPLVAFAFASECPGCGADIESPLDLEGYALQRLARCQRTLLHEVHALASRYGWTEQQILAVAPARRARYLALIEDGA
jgi:hypothetical protein